MTTNREVRKYFQAATDGHYYAYYAYRNPRAEYRTRYARLRLVTVHDKGKADNGADVDAYDEDLKMLTTIPLPLHREKRHRALVPVDTNLYQVLTATPLVLEQMNDVSDRLTDYQDYDITPRQLCADMRKLAERLHNLSSVMHRLGPETSDRALDDPNTVLSPWT